MNDSPNGAAVQHRLDAPASTRPRLASGAAKSPRRRGADYYDTILWRVVPKHNETAEGFAVGVTGCERRAGVSTVAANLAIRAADHRLSPVVLVDANLQHPRQDRHFRLYDEPGLTEVLAEECDLPDALHETNVDGLSIMPLGSQALVDRTRVDPDALAALIKELRNVFSTIVFDLPEVRELRHALLLAQHVDATLVVLRCDGSSRKGAQASIGRLMADGVNVVGSVVTQHKTHTPEWLRRWL
ncbi:MAG: CpsD/CapB family tyrosine-protein kinase [Planctomycetota bacterium]